MHTKCPECNLEFTPEELHDASLEDHLEYKRITNDLIKELRLKLEHDQVMEWCKAKLNDYVIGLEAENARYREAFSEIMIAHASYEPASMIAREALKGE